MLTRSRNDALKTATGLADLEACQVPHCWNAQAVSLTFPTGFKFSYSGDCRPSQNIVKIGKGSTVLLHEATFDDELQGDAEAKKHSTTSEAIGVGLAMGAQRVILTHFSQRYQKIPIMDKLSLKHIKLETAEGNAESDILLGTEADSLPTPEDVVMQDTGGMEDLARSSGPTDFMEAGERSSEAQVEATDSVGIQTGKSTSRAHSRHNSQPESEVVIVPEAAKQMKVCVAFDYMRIKVKEIAHMEKFTPALLELYQQDEEADKFATRQQEPDTVKERKKRKDESDDESSKGNKKKSNEEINRGKSNGQIRKEQRRTNQPGKDQSEGKHNAGVGNTASMRLRVGSGPNGRIIYTDNIKSLSPINEAASAMSTGSTEPEMKRHIPPTEKRREKALFPMAAFPSTPRTTTKRARRVRSLLQPNWDLTQENVANEVEGDLREAQQTASHRV